jgi:hypothetical protein
VRLNWKIRPMVQIMSAVALAHKHTTCAEGGHGAGRFARGEEKRRSAAPPLMMLGCALINAPVWPNVRSWGDQTRRDGGNNVNDPSPK